jgi:hypothetical protein
VYLLGGPQAHLTTASGQEKVMAHRGPVITTVVVLGGLLGLMIANSAGGGETGAAAPAAAQTSTAAAPAAAQTSTAAAPSPATTTKPAPPPTPQFPAQVVYAGKAQGTHIAIAVAVKGDQSAAYLCDGRDVEAWLRGTAKNGQVDLKSKSGKSHLVGRLNGKKLTGTITLSTKDYAFTIGVAPPPAGLYRGRGGTTTVGWIVLPDGSQVGIQTTGTTRKAAPELDPAQGGVTVDGQSLTAVPVAGDTTF